MKPDATDVVDRGVAYYKGEKEHDGWEAVQVLLEKV